MSLNANALITLNDLKESLSITDSTQDSLLEGIINRSSQVIETYVGHPIKSATYTQEKYDGAAKIVLDKWPVTAITSVQYQTGDIGNPDWDDVDSTSYALERDGDRGILLLQSPIAGEDAYRVTYTAGYTDVPEDIKQACLELCEYTFNMKASGGKKSETLGEYSVTYQSYTKGDLLGQLGVDLILDFYRTPTI